MTLHPARRDWNDLEDAELVRLYRDKSLDAALETLVRRYQVRLFRVVLGIVDNRGLAEELCQRAFVKAALKIDQLKNDEAFFGWLLTIARTATMDELRSRSRRKTLQSEYQQKEAVADPSGQREARSTVKAVLQKMSAEERVVILLADLEGQSMQEIAEALDISESAAKMRVKRAREQFRTFLEAES